MRIRIINENGWEKNFDIDKSIIRIGSQFNCDVQIQDNRVQPVLAQIVRSGGIDQTYNIFFFAEGVTLTRGEQVFPAELTVSYDVLDGDKISFSGYQMMVSLEDDKTRVRTSFHMKAELYLSSRELTPESAINGVIYLSNLGTEKPCQFRMHISGIPESCLHSAPLPYLHPGARSSVGFIITHLKTLPSPGFHTVSVTISAPDEYFGEALEFNQDIYVSPVFDNEMILEDDSENLTGFNNKQQETAGTTPVPAAAAGAQQNLVESSRMNPDAEANSDIDPAAKATVKIMGSSDAANPDVFGKQEEDDYEPYSRRKKKQSMVVIRHNEGSGFDDEAEEETAAETKDPAVSEQPVPAEPAAPESSRPAEPVTPESSKPAVPVTPESSQPEEPAAPESSQPAEPVMPESSQPEEPAMPESSQPEAEAETAPEAAGKKTKPAVKKRTKKADTALAEEKIPPEPEAEPAPLSPEAEVLKPEEIPAEPEAEKLEDEKKSPEEEPAAEAEILPAVKKSSKKKRTVKKAEPETEQEPQTGAEAEIAEGLSAADTENRNTEADNIRETGTLPAGEPAADEAAAVQDIVNAAAEPDAGVSEKSVINLGPGSIMKQEKVSPISDEPPVSEKETEARPEPVKVTSEKTVSAFTVIHGNQGFDDDFEDDSPEETPDPEKESKPEIFVTKGGSFDD